MNKRTKLIDEIAVRVSELLLLEEAVPNLAHLTPALLNYILEVKAALEGLTNGFKEPKDVLDAIKMTGRYANLRRFDSQGIFYLIASKVKTSSFKYGPYSTLILKFPDGIEEAITKCKELFKYVDRGGVDDIAIEDTIELMEYIFAQTSELIASNVMLYKGRQRAF